MTFRYTFLLTLDESQRQQRRQLLAYYATVAQISFLAILIAIRIYFVLSWLENKWLSGGKDARPSSPYVKHNRLAVSTSWSVRVRRYWQRWQWWLGEPILVGWGTMGEWLVGGIWMAWLLLLSYLHTAPGNAFWNEIISAWLTIPQTTYTWPNDLVSLGHRNCLSIIFWLWNRLVHRSN